MAWLQGAGDVQDRPRGWSLAHLAAALGRAAALGVLLSHGAPAAGWGSILCAYACISVMLTKLQ